jgi:hypothetical protein
MKPIGIIFLFLTLIAVLAQAQSTTGFGPAPAPSGSSAQILPLSGRNNQSGSVSTAEQPVPGTTTSVNTLNPTVEISGPYSGSARSTKHMPFSGKLSLADALKRALSYNLGAVDMSQSARQSSAESRAARSALLPNLSGSLSETVEQVDLAALGVRFNLPTAFAGFGIPTVVGPFNYFALQASLSQTVANLTTLDNYRAARATARAI